MLTKIEKVAKKAGISFDFFKLGSSAEADVIISITRAFSALYMGQHVNATTNIARRKTELKGKQ